MLQNLVFATLVFLALVIPMARLQSASAPLEADMNSPLPPNPLTSVDVPPRLRADLTQIMLKCLEPGELTASHRAITPQSAIPAAVLTTTEQMVHVVEDLRSPDSGWPADVPQTPEHLIPYITEEVHDVLDALHAAAIAVEPVENRWQQYTSLQSLLPWLLWAIARSSYEVMRLIEGIPSKRLDGGLEQSGILRLVARMDITAADFSTTLDLATQQSPAVALGGHVLLQSEVCSLCREATTTTALLHPIIEQVSLTTPLLIQFFEGMQADLLVPHQSWQTGLLELQLEFDFVPTGEPLLESPGLPPNPTLQFTETEWLDDYSKTVQQRQLSDAIAHLPGFQAAVAQPLGDREPLVPQLVADSCQLAEWLKSPVAQSNQQFLRRNLSLSDFSRWILWCLSRSTYEITQLVGGIQATLLQPGTGWQTGTLRLLAALQLKTVEHDWYLDLGTGQALPYTLESVPVPPDSLVQSTECTWCERPDVFQRLQDQVTQHLNATTPELQLLIQGTGIDLLEAEHWEPGAIQLTVALDFIPDEPITP